ncbi:phosphatidate cytidylyltransferase [Amorphus coralli]|uniref:phosphatidate cytidylyltransferase n=1 Tax=Amorphus coralli TaxID=340680 RepID=UPI00037FB048|nr:phosphatidate cytidylyltransferase [Amorphus coralli]
MANDPATPSRRNADLTQRTLSAIVLGPAALVLAWIGGVTFLLGVSALGIVVMVEWFRMVDVPVRTAAFVVSVAGVVGANLATLVAGPETGLGVLLGAVIVAALTVNTAAGTRSPVRGARAWIAAGLLYVGLGTLAFVLLRAERYGLTAVVVVFLVAWSTDVFAYFVGRTVGGPKLWPLVSPKKTWSGTIGGLVAGAAAGAAALAWLGDPVTAAAIAVALLLAVVAVLGDLLESAAKRRFGIKDSSKLIPGHGGLMDRVDGLLAAGMVAVIIGLLWAEGGDIAGGLLAAMGSLG